MDRRKFLAGLGSLAAGGAAAMGTGAFASQEAVRGSKVKLKSDRNAAIKLIPTGDYAKIGGTNGRTLRLKFRLQNDDALTEYGEQFSIGNREQPSNPDEDYETWITLDLNALSNNEDNEGGRIIAFDTSEGDQLNNVTNSKPSSPPVIGPGESVDVAVTVDTRYLKNQGLSYGDKEKLVNTMTVHTERVDQ
jgi:hypothetical protein